RAVDVDLLLADGKSLQGRVADVAHLLDPLAFLPWSEGAGKLGESEDTLAVELAQLLLAHGLQQADVVLLNCHRTASLPKLADLAVPVQRQLRRLASCLEPLQLVQNLLGLAVEFRIELDLAQPAFGTACYQPNGRS